MKQRKPDPEAVANQIAQAAGIPSNGIAKKSRDASIMFWGDPAIRKGKTQQQLLRERR